MAAGPWRGARTRIEQSWRGHRITFDNSRRRLVNSDFGSANDLRVGGSASRRFGFDTPVLFNRILQQEGEVMKTSASAVVKSLAVAALLGGSALFTTGCSHTDSLSDDLLAPPAYTAGENFHRQLRYAAYDWHQGIDDFDENVTMTRPGSMLTHWAL